MPHTFSARLAHPPLLRHGPLALAVRRLAPGDIRATPEQRAHYLRRYPRLGDPDADALVAMVARLPAGQGWRLIETALEDGIDTLIDPPEELRRFFTAVAVVPYWVDPDQLDHGCRVTARTGPAGVTALAMLALCGGYLARRVTKALIATGRLDTDAPRRLAATLAWWHAVTTPGGMHPGAPGFTATVRVRITHAMVRAGLARRPDWDHHDWDTSLNASQLAGTLALFALAPLAGSQAAGLHLSADERASVYALWRYTGHVLGVPAAILPATERDAWHMLWIQADYEFRDPDHDSETLAQALIPAIGTLCIGDGRDPLSCAGRYALTETMSAYARLLLGDRNADTLGISDRKTVQAILIAAALATRALEYPRRIIPGATRCAEILGGCTITALTRRMTTHIDTAPR